MADLQDVPDSVDNVVSGGHASFLQLSGVRHGDIGSGDADGGGVQVVEGVRLHDGGEDLGADAGLGPAELD